MKHKDLSATLIKGNPFSKIFRVLIFETIPIESFVLHFALSLSQSFLSFAKKE